MHTINLKGPFGRDCVLVILFQHYSPRLGFLNVSMTPPNVHVGRTNPVLLYLNSNNSKSKKTANIIL